MASFQSFARIDWVVNFATGHNQYPFGISEVSNCKISSLQLCHFQAACGFKASLELFCLIFFLIRDDLTLVPFVSIVNCTVVLISFDSSIILLPIDNIWLFDVQLWSSCRDYLRGITIFESGASDMSVSCSATGSVRLDVWNAQHYLMFWGSLIVIHWIKCRRH